MIEKKHFKFKTPEIKKIKLTDKFYVREFFSNEKNIIGKKLFKPLNKQLINNFKIINVANINNNDVTKNEPSKIKYRLATADDKKIRAALKYGKNQIFYNNNNNAFNSNIDIKNKDKNDLINVHKSQSLQKYDDTKKLLLRFNLISEENKINVEPKKHKAFKKTKEGFNKKYQLYNLPNISLKNLNTVGSKKNIQDKNIKINIKPLYNVSISPARAELKSPKFNNSKFILNNINIPINIPLMHRKNQKKNHTRNNNYLEKNISEFSGLDSNIIKPKRKINDNLTINNISIIPKNDLLKNKLFKLPISSKCSSKKILKYYFKEEINKQFNESMEDFIDVNPKLTEINGQPLSFFAIYDGHNGPEVSSCLKENFSKLLNKNIHKASKLDLKLILSETFKEFDNLLAKDSKYKTKGSTATVLLLLNNEKLICANVGDTQCYIASEKQVKLITKIHNCSNPSEVNRIKKREGKVFKNRVFGSLFVTRAFGDNDYKEFGVEAIADIKEINLMENKIKFIVLASDGVWDVVSEEELMEECKKYSNEKDLCERLINVSLERYTTDNCSCIVIKV